MLGTILGELLMDAVLQLDLSSQMHASAEAAMSQRYGNGVINFQGNQLFFYWTKENLKIIHRKEEKRV
jgi:hypothetical protein